MSKMTRGAAAMAIAVRAQERLNLPIIHDVVESPSSSVPSRSKMIFGSGSISRTYTWLDAGEDPLRVESGLYASPVTPDGPQGRSGAQAFNSGRGEETLTAWVPGSLRAPE